MPFSWSEIHTKVFKKFSFHKAVILVVFEKNGQKGTMFDDDEDEFDKNV